MLTLRSSNPLAAVVSVEQREKADEWAGLGGMVGLRNCPMDGQWLSPNHRCSLPVTKWLLVEPAKVSKP